MITLREPLRYLRFIFWYAYSFFARHLTSLLVNFLTFLLSKRVRWYLYQTMLTEWIKKGLFISSSGKTFHQVFPVHTWNRRSKDIKYVQDCRNGIPHSLESLYQGAVEQFTSTYHEKPSRRSRSLTWCQGATDIDLAISMPLIYSGAIFTYCS